MFYKFRTYVKHAASFFLLTLRKFQEPKSYHVRILLKHIKFNVLPKNIQKQTLDG